MTDKPNPSVSHDTTPRLVLATGHSDDVLHAAFLRDGKTIASLGSDRALILWDAQTGEMLHKYDYPGPDFYWQGLSPDGLHAVASTSWNRVAVIDTLTGSEVRVFEDSSPTLAVSHDGHMLACEDGTGITITDLLTATIVGRLSHNEKRGIRFMVFSPDDRLLAIAPDAGADGIHVYEMASGHCVRTLKLPSEEGQGWAYTEQMDISPDGRLLVSHGMNEGVSVWDLQTGQHLWTLADSGVMAVRFSADHRTLLVGRVDGTICEWDVETWETRQTRAVSHHWVRTVAQSPDGRYTLTGGDDRALHLWDPQTGDLCKSMGGHEYRVRESTFAPDGHTLLSSNSDGTLRSWDVGTCRLVDTTMTADGHADHVIVSPDGLLVAQGNNLKNRACSFAFSTAVELRRTDTCELLHTLRMPHRSGGPVSAVFSPDGRTLAIGHWGFCVSVWDVSTGELVAKIRTRGDSVGAIAFSPDGKTLAVGTHYDEVVELFSTRTFRRKRMLIEHTDNVNSVAFSPDGKTLATGTSDGTIKLWNPRNGRLLNTLVILPSAAGISREWLAYTPEGYYTGSGNAEEFIRWEVDGALHPGTLYAEKFRRSRLP